MKKSESQNSITKKFFYSKLVIVLLLTIFFLGGCQKYNHPIAGKTFENSLVIQAGVEYFTTYITFSKNGKFTIRNKSRIYFDSSDFTIDHLKWETKGNDITIRYDHSTKWKASARGTVYMSGYYNPIDNSVVLGTSSSSNITYNYAF
jgi:hypothetical protein